MDEPSTENSALISEESEFWVRINRELLPKIRGEMNLGNNQLGIVTENQALIKLS